MESSLPCPFHRQAVLTTCVAVFLRKRQDLLCCVLQAATAKNGTRGTQGVLVALPCLWPLLQVIFVVPCVYFLCFRFAPNPLIVLKGRDAILEGSN